MPATSEPYPRFSAGEFTRRRERVRGMMERLGCEALVIFGHSMQNGTGQADVYYLSHHLGRQENYLVFPGEGDGVLLVQSFNHVPNAVRQSVVEDTRWGGPSSAQAVVQVLREKRLDRGRVGLVGPVPYQAYTTLREQLPDATFQDVTADYRLLRVVKSPEELAWVRRGAELTDAALAAMVDGVRPGMREHALAALLGDGYLSEGGQDHLHYISSTPQDAPDRCVPAQTLSDRTLAEGDVILTEISIAYGGYAGQIHRPVILGSAPNKLYADLYAVAELAYQRVCEAIKPGASTEEVLEAADVIADRGYTICDGLLHGFAVGLLPPSLRTRQTAARPARPFVFDRGMTVVVQPNVVTHDGRAGVQVGNLVLVEDDGVRPLQGYPLGFIRV